MKTILNGIFKENPIFVLTLGLCSALAVTNTVENAYMMGICLTLVLVLSNVFVSLIRKLVPNSVQIPVYILIIGTFVSIIEILLAKYLPAVYSALGIYLALIVVNCIILGRTIAVASKSSVGRSFLDGLGIGIGYTLALIIIALFREILGTNTITIMQNISPITGYRAVYTNIFPTSSIFPISIFNKEAGAFITLGLIIAFFNWIKLRREKHDN